MSERRFRILVAAALTDGNIGLEECAVLEVAAQEFGVDPARIDSIIQATKDSQGGAPAAIPGDPQERAEVFRSLVDLVAADRKIDESELKFFKRIAPQFSLDELQVEDLLRAATETRRKPPSQ